MCEIIPHPALLRSVARRLLEAIGRGSWSNLTYVCLIKTGRIYVSSWGTGGYVGICNRTLKRRWVFFKKDPLADSTARLIGAYRPAVQVVCQFKKFDNVWYVTAASDSNRGMWVSL